MNEELKVIISAEVSKLKQGVDEAKKAVGTFRSELDKHKEAIGKAWTTTGEAATKASKVIIGGVAAAGTALVGAAVATKDYRTEQAKLNAAFETAKASAGTAKTVYNDLYRVLGESDTSVEAANHLAQLTNDQKALSEWTNICQGVYATFGASLPIEGLTEAANETAKVGTLTGSLADALNWAGVNEEDFQAKLDACNTEAEREALIRETLSGLYDEAAANYEKTAADVLAQNEAQAKLDETMAKLGETVAPLITAFTSLATDALAVVVPYVQQLGEQYGPQIKEVLQGISEKLAPIAEFIANNLPAIATVAGIILGIAAAYQIITGAMAAYNAVKTAYTTITGIATAAQTAFAAANWAAMAPILAVVAAIAAVIAIVVICIKYWDEISAAVGKAWDWIKEKTSAAVEAVKNAISNAFQKAKEIVTNIFNAIASKIKEKIEFAKNIVSNVVTAITSIFKGDFGAAKQAALNIFDSIKNGIKEKIENAKNTVKNVIDAIKKFFNFEWSLPKLKMPSVKITGKFSLSPLEVPKFSISWNKLGGVFEKPTLFNYGGSLQGLGEDGAEAVVPLERNTEWLDRLATMLDRKLGGGRPIVLQVDGKTFAQISVDSINDLTRQTGYIPLKIM